MKNEQLPAGNLQLVILLLIGFIAAQFLSTVDIFFSNAVFHDTLKAVHDAGYLAVPNMIVAQSLTCFSSAFNGGLFFSFTSGLSLTILTVFAAWIWYILFHKSRPALIILVLIWAASILIINQNGLSSLITSYLILIPCTIFPVFGKLFPDHIRSSSRPVLFTHIALFMLFSISIGYFSQGKAERFLDIRDFLLLRNPTGSKLNAFYYDNSLYSANYFKSYSQQLIKTCDLNSIQDEHLKQKLSHIFKRFDYIPLPASVQADLTLIIQDNKINFFHQNKAVLAVSVNDFLNSPKQWIKQFESNTDQHGIFRMITMASLLFTGAVLLYSIFFLLPFLLIRLFAAPFTATILASLICILTLFLLFAGSTGNKNFTSEQISTVLASEDSTARIRVLRYVVDHKMDITLFPEYKTLINDGTTPERYWIAKSLSIRDTENNREDLHKLLTDKHFNVVCMALYSLGKLGKKGDIPIILDTIRTSPNWYVQWYAYKALRNLGWQQKILN
ncbi:MAG: HEAT repeat domain-containing protein [Deltaproteobacteria bacterium]|nr:MAG: HEAT repeat domain-containing protein [Deltaproteobacteria bacterium]